MDVLEVGVAAGGEGAQKIQRRRRLAIGFQLPARIGLARCGRELDVVDDVAAIGRQGDAIDRLVVGRAGLRELAGDTSDLHDRRRGGEGHHHRHLQEHPEEIADVVGRMFAEALGAIAALQKERIACGRLAERLLEFARFACKNQRRIAGKLALGLGQRRTIGIDRRLRDRLRPPAIRGPSLVQHDPRLRERQQRRLLKVNGPIYSPALKANMPIFEGEPHFMCIWQSPFGAFDRASAKPNPTGIEALSFELRSSSRAKRSNLGERRALDDPRIAASLRSSR